MKHATYIGPIAHLKGKTALIKTAGEDVLAQFDNMDLTKSGKPMSSDHDTPPTDALGFNWHKFPKTDFEETP